MGGPKANCLPSRTVWGTNYLVISPQFDRIEHQDMSKDILILSFYTIGVKVNLKLFIFLMKKTYAP